MAQPLRASSFGVCSFKGTDWGRGLCKYLHWMDLQGERSVFTQRPAYANASCYYVTMGAEFQQPVGARNTSGWAAEMMHDLFAFLIL